MEDSILNRKKKISEQEDTHNSIIYNKDKENIPTSLMQNEMKTRIAGSRRSLEMEPVT